MWGAIRPKSTKSIQFISVYQTIYCEYNNLWFFNFRKETWICVVFKQSLAYFWKFFCVCRFYAFIFCLQYFFSCFSFPFSILFGFIHCVVILVLLSLISRISLLLLDFPSLSNWLLFVYFLCYTIRFLLYHNKTGKTKCCHTAWNFV